jgi:hypothetical protein
MQLQCTGAVALDSLFENGTFPFSLKQRKTDGFSYEEKQEEMSFKCVFPISTQQTHRS